MTVRIEFVNGSEPVEYRDRPGVSYAYDLQPSGALRVMGVRADKLIRSSTSEAVYGVNAYSKVTGDVWREEDSSFAVNVQN